VALMAAPSWANAVSSPTTSSDELTLALSPPEGLTARYSRAIRTLHIPLQHHGNGNSPNANIHSHEHRHKHVAEPP
jgi:hypothetical protein